MIEKNKKYKLKKIKGFEFNDEGLYTVLEILKNDTIVCEREDGERYLFMKDFLIDPEKPDEVYSKFELIRG